MTLWYFGTLVLTTLAIVRLVIELIQAIIRYCNPFVWQCDKSGDGRDGGGVVAPQWAVITGATDGIGYEFARQLAAKGYHLLLLSRNENKLQQVKEKILQEIQSISTSPPLSIETLMVNFSNLSIYDQVEHFLHPYQDNISILVNNVGTVQDLPSYFHTVDSTEKDEMEIDTDYSSSSSSSSSASSSASSSSVSSSDNDDTDYELIESINNRSSSDSGEVESSSSGSGSSNNGSKQKQKNEQNRSKHIRIRNSAIINTNVVSMTKMCELVLPSMINRRHGLMINCSSASALKICPLLSVYAASKAYVQHLSESLAEECRNTGVTIVTLPIFLVSTPMTRYIPNWFGVAPSAEAYVRSVLCSIRSTQSVCITGYWIHSAMYIGLRVLEMTLSRQLCGQLMRWYLGKIRQYFQRQHQYQPNHHHQPIIRCNKKHM